MVDESLFIDIYIMYVLQLSMCEKVKLQRSYKTVVSL